MSKSLLSIGYGRSEGSETLQLTVRSHELAKYFVTLYNQQRTNYFTEWFGMANPRPEQMHSGQHDVIITLKTSSTSTQPQNSRTLKSNPKANPPLSSSPKTNLKSNPNANPPLSSSPKTNLKSNPKANPRSNPNSISNSKSSESSGRESELFGNQQQESESWKEYLHNQRRHEVVGGLSHLGKEITLSTQRFRKRVKSAIDLFISLIKVQSLQGYLSPHQKRTMTHPNDPSMTHPNDPSMTEPNDRNSIDPNDQSGSTNKIRLLAWKTGTDTISSTSKNPMTHQHSSHHGMASPVDVSSVPSPSIELDENEKEDGTILIGSTRTDSRSSSSSGGREKKKIAKREQRKSSHQHRRRKSYRFLPPPYKGKLVEDLTQITLLRDSYLRTLDVPFEQSQETPLQKKIARINLVKLVESQRRIEERFTSLHPFGVPLIDALLRHIDVLPEIIQLNKNAIVLGHQLAQKVTQGKARNKKEYPSYAWYKHSIQTYIKYTKNSNQRLEKERNEKAAYLNTPLEETQLLIPFPTVRELLDFVKPVFVTVLQSVMLVPTIVEKTLVKDNANTLNLHQLDIYQYWKLYCGKRSNRHPPASLIANLMMLDIAVGTEGYDERFVFDPLYGTSNSEFSNPVLIDHFHVATQRLRPSLGRWSKLIFHRSSIFRRGSLKKWGGDIDSKKTQKI
eukprot:g752.t1